jgi:hypothetical protein
MENTTSLHPAPKPSSVIAGNRARSFDIGAETQAARSTAPGNPHNKVTKDRSWA